VNITGNITNLIWFTPLLIDHTLNFKVQENLEGGAAVLHSTPAITQVTWKTLGEVNQLHCRTRK